MHRVREGSEVPARQNRGRGSHVTPQKMARLPGYDIRHFPFNSHLDERYQNSSATTTKYNSMNVKSV